MLGRFLRAASVACFLRFYGSTRLGRCRSGLTEVIDLGRRAGGEMENDRVFSNLLALSLQSRFQALELKIPCRFFEQFTFLWYLYLEVLLRFRCSFRVGREVLLGTRFEQRRQVGLVPLLSAVVTALMTLSPRAGVFRLLLFMGNRRCGLPFSRQFRSPCRFVPPGLPRGEHGGQLSAQTPQSFSVTLRWVGIGLPGGRCSK